MTETQKQLADIVTAYVNSEWIEKQSAFRDLLTDMRHVADHLEVDFFDALDGSYEAYRVEKEELANDTP